jgi:hypothetical protein
MKTFKRASSRWFFSGGGIKTGLRPQTGRVSQTKKQTDQMATPLRWNMTLPNGEPLRFDTPGARWDGTVEEVMAAINQQNNTPMTNDNRVSADIAATDITAIQAAIATIRSKLPFLITVGAQERIELPKLGVKTIGFHEKCTAYMASNPEFIPPFVEPAEVAKDIALRDEFHQFLPQLLELVSLVTGTEMVVGSEIYMADLAYYQSTREAARRGRPGAEDIYNDLQSRFPGAPPKGATPSAKKTP